MQYSAAQLWLQRLHIWVHVLSWLPRRIYKVIFVDCSSINRYARLCDAVSKLNELN